MFFFSFQDYSKDAVAHVQKYLMKNEVPVNLFEVSSVLIMPVRETQSKALILGKRHELFTFEKQGNHTDISAQMHSAFSLFSR